MQPHNSSPSAFLNYGHSAPPRWRWALKRVFRVWLVVTVIAMLFCAVGSFDLELPGRRYGWGGWFNFAFSQAEGLFAGLGFGVPLGLFSLLYRPQARPAA